MLETCKKFYADVVICGGGPAGAAAGIAAAREGKSAILLELRESLGGLCTNGYITGLAGVVTGIAEEWLQRLDKEGHATIRPHLPCVEPEYGKVMLERMVLQAGCTILYGTHVVDCEVIDGRITKIIAYCKQGKIEVIGNVFIDATGDADLTMAAGAPTVVGAPEFAGLNQSVTMGFRLAYVNMKEYNEANDAWRKDPEFDPEDSRKRSLIVYREHQAYAAGDLPDILSPGNIVYPMPVKDPTCTDVTLDATHSFDCRNDDVVDLTRQIVDQHRKVVWFVEFLRKWVPGFEDCVLESMAPMNGVRDSRRAVGEYTMTGEDVAAGRKFEDGVVQHTEFFDAHVPTPGFHTAVRHIHLPYEVPGALCRPSQDDENHMFHPLVPMGGYEVRVDPRNYCEIPFRSLIAKNISNLFTVGRCFSADFHASGCIRVIAPSMSMGQAAGIGASMALDKDLKALKELNGKLVRERMIGLGVPLNEAPGGYWKMLREFPGEPRVGAADSAEMVGPNGERPAR